jgi:hypothetical protein
VLFDEFATHIYEGTVLSVGVEATEEIWLTCCALHNFLLKADGLSKHWGNGVPSDWEGDWGRHSELDATNHVPFAIRRLLQPDKVEAGIRYLRHGTPQRPQP